MEVKDFFPQKGELGNTWTHFIGAIFALSSIWIIWPAVKISWQMAMGVIFFIVGMFIMFLSSTLYHWVHPSLAKRILRKCDHISIYVMIACSYTPICIGVIGGWIGWLVFGLQWAAVIGGVFYKIFAFGKYPRLSLTIYLMVLLFAEGLFYTCGVFFFAHDSHKYYHAIWHIFVLLGAIAHWSVVLCIVLNL